MSGTYLSLTNNTLARLNEVQLTSSNFSAARGIQIQAQNAVNEAIRYVNQKEYNFPFNHATETKTLTAGTVRYSLPTSTKHVDYNTFRLVKDEDLATSGGKLTILQYNDYINSHITQEDEINTTTLDGSLTDSATTITVVSTTGFDSTGTLHIGNEEVTYTFMDVNPKNGENYYRLTQTDIDGTSKSFTPIVVACESRVDDYKIFPNPTNTTATIEFNLEYYQGNNIQLNIKDINGKNRKTIPVELVRGYNRFTIEMEDLPKGFYIIEFIGTRNHLPEKKIVRI